LFTNTYKELFHKKNYVKDYQIVKYLVDH